MWVFISLTVASIVICLTSILCTRFFGLRGDMLKQTVSTSNRICYLFVIAAFFYNLPELAKCRSQLLNVCVIISFSVKLIVSLKYSDIAEAKFQTQLHFIFWAGLFRCFWLLPLNIDIILMQLYIIYDISVVSFVILLLRVNFCLSRKVGNPMQQNAIRV